MEQMDIDLETPQVRRYKTWNAPGKQPRKSVRETAAALLRPLPMAGLFFLLSLDISFTALKVLTDSMTFIFPTRYFTLFD